MAAEENKFGAYEELVHIMRATRIDVTPRADLTARILSAVAAERATPRRNLVWWWLAAAASIALVFSVWAIAPTTPRTQACVAFLEKTQAPDGSWSPAAYGGSDAYRPAVTALAMLALPRGAHRTAARDALVAMPSMTIIDRAAFYNHAMMACALAAEADNPVARATLVRLVDMLVACQRAAGGWDYEINSDGNAAVTAWCVRALERAETAGVAKARIPLRRGLRWLRGNVRADGSIAYRRGEAKQSECVTALAAYALLTGGGRYPEARQAGERAAQCITVATSMDDYYRNYAKALVFDALGASWTAHAIHDAMAAHFAENRHDQWFSAGGSVYAAAVAASR